MTLDQIVLPKPGITVRERIQQITDLGIPGHVLLGKSQGGEIVGSFEDGSLELVYHQEIPHLEQVDPNIFQYLKIYNPSQHRFEVETSRPPLYFGETNRQPNELAQKLGKALGLEHYPQQIGFAVGRSIPIEVHAIYFPKAVPDQTVYFMMPARSELARLARR